MHLKNLSTINLNDNQSNYILFIDKIYHILFILCIQSIIYLIIQ